MGDLLVKDHNFSSEPGEGKQFGREKLNWTHDEHKVILR